jgi:hypothetical protein
MDKSPAEQGDVMPWRRETVVSIDITFPDGRIAVLHEERIPEIMEEGKLNAIKKKVTRKMLSALSAVFPALRTWRKENDEKKENGRMRRVRE